jgi:hypothetical protein
VIRGTQVLRVLRVLRVDARCRRSAPLLERAENIGVAYALRKYEGRTPYHARVLLCIASTCVVSCGAPRTHSYPVRRSCIDARLEVLSGPAEHRFRCLGSVGPGASTSPPPG